MNIGKLKRSTQIAIMTGSGSSTVEKTASGTSPLTLSDSVAENIISLTINGRSEVSAGSIVSVGDNGLTVTTANSDNTLTTSAELTTALPLRGVSDTVQDVIKWDGSSGMATKKYGKAKLSDFTWTLNARGYFSSNEEINDAKIIPAGNLPLLLIPNYTPETFYNIYAHTQLYDKVCAITNGDPGSPLKRIYIIDKQYATVNDFMQAINALSAVYELAEPVTTPLTTAEISALRGLRTFDPTTNISVTDNPLITVTYIGKKTTLTAPKKRKSRKKKA